jgi:hypothetical protein
MFFLLDYVRLRCTNLCMDALVKLHTYVRKFLFFAYEDVWEFY